MSFRPQGIKMEFPFLIIFYFSHTITFLQTTQKVMKAPCSFALFWKLKITINLPALSL